MHDAFEQFGAFTQDALDNKELLTKAANSQCRCWPLARKVLHSAMAEGNSLCGDDVTVGIVPASGHWGDGRESGRHTSLSSISSPSE